MKKDLFYCNIHVKGRIIQIGTLVYWSFFWLLSSIDKFINQPTFLWYGKDRITQFTEYFSSIGLDHFLFIYGALIVITLLEIAAFILVTYALYYLLRNNCRKADAFFFWGTFVGLVIFSIFTIGDQIFGERGELLEHTIYWISLIISWTAYTYFPDIPLRPYNRENNIQ